jgi:glutathione S-transferase
MITLYHLNNSRSERIVWLMEELGLPYRLEAVTREPSGLAPASLHEIHRMGKAPVIRDGDVVLVESAAICEYIIHRHGGGRLAVPASSPDYPRYLEWLHFAEGSAMLQFLAHRRLRRLTGGDESDPIFDWSNELNARHTAYMDAALGERPYFGGEDFSAADIMMGFVIAVARDLVKIDLAPYPNLTAYIARIAERPAYQKAMAIANPQAETGQR